MASIRQPGGQNQSVPLRFDFSYEGKVSRCNSRLHFIIKVTLQLTFKLTFTVNFSLNVIQPLGNQFHTLTDGQVELTLQLTVEFTLRLTVKASLNAKPLNSKLFRR